MKGYIRRRGAGSWEVTVELGIDPVTNKRIRQTRNLRGNRRDAERVQAQLINAVDTGAYTDSRQGTVADYLERWLRDYAAQTVAPRTFEGYRGGRTHPHRPKPRQHPARPTQASAHRRRGAGMVGGRQNARRRVAGAAQRGTDASNPA